MEIFIHFGNFVVNRAAKREISIGLKFSFSNGYPADTTSIFGTFKTTGAD